MRKYVMLVVGNLCLYSLFAQENLSLSDAIQIGLQNNYDILIEQRNVLAASNLNAWGEAGRWPTITLDINQNNGLTDNIKTANPFQLQDKTLANSINPGINVNWVLFNGFKINMTKRRLDQMEAESEGNASIVIANTIQSIILGYYLAVLERDRLDQFQKQLILSSDRYRYMQAKADIGTAVTTDLLLEEGNYLTDSVNLVNQRLAYRNALRNLNVLLAVDNIETPYSLTDSLTFDFPEYEYGDLKAKMLDENVDLKKQYITQSILRTTVAVNRADRYPEFSLNAGTSGTMSRVDLSSASFRNDDGSFSPGPADPLTAVTTNYFANFRLSFTLFNGGRINRAIRNAVILEDIGNLRIDKLQTSLERDLQEAYDRYQIRRQLYGINERRERVAATNLDISTDKYKNGSINSFDFRVVQNEYLSASIQKYQALYNLVDAQVDLMRLTGGILAEYRGE